MQPFCVSGAARHEVLRCRPGTPISDGKQPGSRIGDAPFRASRFTLHRVRDTLIAASVFVSSVVSAQTFTPRDENPEDYPAGAGRDDTFYACTACHGFKLVAQQGMTRRQWEDSLQWMTDRHGMSPLPAKEQKVVLDYLEATFPPRQPAGRGGWQNPFAPR